MAEKYYIPPSEQQTGAIDWSGLTSKLTAGYELIKQQREKERESLDALVDVNSKILQETQLGKSPNVNEFILKGTETGRSKLLEWNKLLKSGQLSPSEYKKRINNLMDGWNQFAITTKTYDERMQEIFKNQQPDENGVVKGSALELERANELAQYQDLKNKELMFDDIGKVYLGKLKNGLLDPTSVNDVRSLNNFSNIIDNKVQLSNLVDEGTKEWKSFDIENGATTINDIRQNKDAYAKAKSTLINGILSNNSAIASVLTDYTNDEYDYYLSNDDFLSRVQKRVETENYARELNNKPPMTQDELNKFIDSQKSKFILLRHDDQGILQPELTKEQIKEAFDTVDKEIEIRMGKEVSTDEPVRGGGNGLKEEKENAKAAEENSIMLAGYKATVRAFGGDPDATIASGNWVKSSEGSDFGGLKQGYTYTPVNGRIDVYRGKELVFSAKTPKDLAQYVYNGEPAETGLKWEKARKIAMSGGSNTSNTPKKQSKAPKKGDVVSGYVFLGGDPSNKNNWKKK
jgi:hypothetical protein